MRSRFLLVSVLLLAVATALLPFAAAQETGNESNRPRGGLFSEEGMPTQPLSLGWFILGLYVLLGLVFAGASAHLAVQRALPPVPWFLAGFFLNAVGYLILLTRPRGDTQHLPAGIPGGLHKVPHTYDHQKCPCCGALNHPAARRCPCCDAQLEPKFESEAARWRKQQKPN
jgi:hypothetical protein